MHVHPVSSGVTAHQTRTAIQQLDVVVRFPLTIVRLFIRCVKKKHEREQTYNKKKETPAKSKGLFYFIVMAFVELLL